MKREMFFFCPVVLGVFGLIAFCSLFPTRIPFADIPHWGQATMLFSLVAIGGNLLLARKIKKMF